MTKEEIEKVDAVLEELSKKLLEFLKESLKYPEIFDPNGDLREQVHKLSPYDHAAVSEELSCLLWPRLELKLRDKINKGKKTND